MITLREIEREYDPKSGDFGRGTLIPFDEVSKIESDGYELVEYCFDVPVYGTDGAPTARRWRGYVREEAGKHYVAAVEFIPR